MEKRIIFIGGIGKTIEFGGELTKNKLIIERLKDYCIHNKKQLICIDTYNSNHDLKKKIRIIWR